MENEQAFLRGKIPGKKNKKQNKPFVTPISLRTLKSTIQDFFLSLGKGRGRAFSCGYHIWASFPLNAVTKGMGGHFTCSFFEFFMIEFHLQRRG